MNYDLIIPCHPKDYVKLQYCANSCMKYLNPRPCNIYIVCPDEFETSDDLIKHVSDDEAVNINAQDINFHRKNWIYQQIVKLGQDFTENDLYLCVDSDLIFNKAIDLFDENRPKFFISDREQNHKPYFNFMKKSHDLEKQVNHTFINDFMMFDKKICSEIIDIESGGLEGFLSFCNENLSDDCLLSEFELYGNYVSKHYPKKYSKQETKTKMFGRLANEDPRFIAYRTEKGRKEKDPDQAYFVNRDGEEVGKQENQPWQESEIQLHIEHMKNTDYDLFTMHTWT